jgi:hypothetical protein
MSASSGIELAAPAGQADEALADEGRQAGAEDRQRQAGGDLVGGQAQRQPGKERGHQHAADGAGDKAQQRALVA